MNNKIKKPFLFVQIFSMFFVSGIFLIFDSHNASASTAFYNCSPDGSNALKQCSINGNYGICNAAGVCVDTKAGAICKADGSTAGQQCAANDQNYGLCNAAGNCVDTQGGTLPGSAAPTKSTATTPNSGSTCPTCFTNPLGFSSVEDFLTNGLLVAMQRIIVSLSLVMIVYGALLYITSAGSSQMETGKKAIYAALTGLAIGIAAPSILKELSSVLGWGQSANTAAVNAAPTFTQIAMNVLNFMLGIAGILSLIMILIGAIMYLTSAGDDKKAESGKKIFQYALLGIIIAMSAMILVTQIARFFGTSAASSSTATVNTTPSSGIAPPNGAAVSR